MDNIFCFDQFELDAHAHELRHNGTFVRVNALVLKLLETLVRNPGRLVSKETLTLELWSGRVVSENALAVAVVRLRKLLAGYGVPRASIVTVYRQGYRFTLPVSTNRIKPARNSFLLPQGCELVGRGCVIQQLVAAHSDAQSERGRLVVLRGDAGIGKTCIAELFAGYAHHAGSLVAWGYCRERGSPPLWPILELVRSVASQVRACAVHGTQPGLPREVTERLVPALAGAEAGLQTCALDQLGLMYLAFEQAVSALVEVAKTVPLVLFLDDLHRADEASLELTRYFLALVSRTRILLVATMRPVRRDAGGAALSAAFTHPNCIRVELGPLSQPDVTNYLVGRFGVVDHALSRRVYELCEGNPFCMVELARQLHAGNTVRPALRVPQVARDLVSQRLGAFNEETLEVLTYAAVLGRVFSLPLLAAVLERHPTAVMTTLDHACAAKVVVPAAYAGMEFCFTHGIIHADLYDKQTPAERRMRHLRVAEILEQRPMLAQMSPTALALHTYAALPDGDLHKAVEYSTEAAGIAEQRCAFDEAIRHLQHARDALDLCEDASPQQQFQLLLRQALLVRAHAAHAFCRWRRSPCGTRAN